MRSCPSKIISGEINEPEMASGALGRASWLAVAPFTSTRAPKPGGWGVAPADGSAGRRGWF
jgi:hypothetical protein